MMVVLIVVIVIMVMGLAFVLAMALGTASRRRDEAARRAWEDWRRQRTRNEQQSRPRGWRRRSG